MCQPKVKRNRIYNSSIQTMAEVLAKESSAYIFSTAAAYGNHYTTDEVLSAFLHQQRDNPSFDTEFATRVLNKCGYERHSFVLPLEDLFRRFTREEYLKLRRTHLLGLAQRACDSALEKWGGDRGGITDLFWGTMTGAMDSPTIDIQLVKVSDTWFILILFRSRMILPKDLTCSCYVTESRLEYECRANQY